jgi:hypothetical protein
MLAIDIEALTRENKDFRGELVAAEHSHAAEDD